MILVSDAHFAHMTSMEDYFKRHAAGDVAYQPEWEACCNINERIRNTTAPTQQDLEAIVTLLNNTDQTTHANGSAWHDYKLHVWAVLARNGYRQQS